MDALLLAAFAGREPVRGRILDMGTLAQAVQHFFHHLGADGQNLGVVGAHRVGQKW